MKKGDIVECIDGSNYLLEGSLYTIKNVIQDKHVLLYEIDPPEGFTSFYKNRFRLVEPPDLPEGFFENLFIETLNTKQ